MPWTATMRLVGSRGDYPLDEGKHLVVVAEWFAYADETGIQEGSKYCAVLGYVGSPRQWKLFRRAWRASLGAAREFKASKFFQREAWQSSKSPYYGWTGKKARTHLTALLDTIQRYQVMPIGFAFNIADFQALTEDERRLLTGAIRRNRVRAYGGKAEITSRLTTSGAPTEPYFLGFHYIVTEALKIAPPDATVHFVFDRRKTIEARAIETIQDIRSATEVPDKVKQRIGLVSFGDSDRYEALQAADLYAYVWNRILHNSLTEPLIYAHSRLTRKREGMEIGNAAFYRALLNHQDDERAAFFEKVLGPNHV